MRTWCGRAALVTMAVLALGCNTMGRQPKLSNPTIEPATLKPGDSAVITVKATDKNKIIHRIVGTVQEDARMPLPLRDDGKAPDEAAGDNIWSLQVDVPFMAPPGQFTLELTAYDSRGQAIIVRKSRKETGPLTANCTLVIQYPPESVGTPGAPTPPESPPAQPPAETPAPAQ